MATRLNQFSSVFVLIGLAVIGISARAWFGSRILAMESAIGDQS